MSNIDIICGNLLNEPHRYYHNWRHISNIRWLIREDSNNYTLEEFEILRSVALFHDIIYDPRKDNNELESARVTREKFLKDDKHIDIICRLIELTKPSYYNSDLSNEDPLVQKLIKCFWKYDLDAFYKCDIHILFNNFIKILKEFQFVDYPKFKLEHIKFIAYLSSLNWFDNNMLSKYISIIQSYRPKIGIYAGSFNPFHVGHLSVLEQAERLFDKVIIAQPKDIDRKVKTEGILPFHEVINFDDLLINVINNIKSYADVTLIRGLRNGNDLEYEINMKKINSDLGGYHDTIYLLTNYPHVSSTVVRDLYKYNKMEYIPRKYEYAY
jgi:pantetheine-phosphate adenylyltransferase